MGMISPIDTILKKYNRPVPRYTSYPPATRFVAIGADKTAHQIGLSKAVGGASLYVHIPFCKKLCYYCGCHMRVVNHYDPIQNYLDMLRGEMAIVSRHIQNKIHIDHLHFGGGSPTSIRPDDFRRLVDDLSAHFTFSKDIEICLEADPRNMSEVKIASYKKAGVNRISLGVQSFDDLVLKTINRPQPFATSFRAVETCRDYGIDNINLDLMYGLPHQTLDSVEKTMDMAMLLRPNRVSFFGYAHVPWMKKHMALIPEDSLPDIFVRYQSAKRGEEILSGYGYKAIGLDHYVLEDDSMMKAYKQKKLRRNFQGYTTDTAQTLIGLGVSSISAFPSGYIQNNPDIRAYSELLDNQSLPSSKSLILNQDDMVFRAVIEELMCYLRVDLGAVRQAWNLPDNYFESSLERLSTYIADGLAHIENDVVQVPEGGRIFVRLVASAFDQYLAMPQTPIQRHAQAI